MIIEHIVAQHAEEAAFLWLLRNDAAKQPNYDLIDLAALDGRVEAHIDGLRIAGTPGWKLCEEALEIQEPGEVFAAAVIAFDSDNGERIDKVISKGSRTLENLNALVSSLGWLPFEKIEPWIQRMITANADPYRFLGIAAYAVHRFDPGRALNTAINDPFPLNRARALRAVGELKRKDLLPELHPYFKDNDEGCCFWSAWSASLLGDFSGLEVLKRFFTVNSPYFEHTMQLVLRLMDIPTAQSWLQGLAQFPDTLRYVIQGAGIVGDPSYVPWIIKQMDNKEVSKVAGEAFGMITGLDLTYENLQGEWPAGFIAGPTEEPTNENVEMDPDEELPWPQAALIADWWNQNSQRFADGTRYLGGKPIAVDHCRSVLKIANQRQRAAAALELAIRVPNEPLFGVCAPGFRQKKDLAY